MCPEDSQNKLTGSEVSFGDLIIGDTLVVVSKTTGYCWLLGYVGGTMFCGGRQGRKHYLALNKWRYWRVKNEDCEGRQFTVPAGFEKLTNSHTHIYSLSTEFQLFNPRSGQTITLTARTIEDKGYVSMGYWYIKNESPNQSPYISRIEDIKEDTFYMVTSKDPKNTEGTFPILVDYVSSNSAVYSSNKIGYIFSMWTFEEVK